MSKNFITGFFRTRAAAEAAVDALIKRGYSRDDISVLMSDATRNKEFAVQAKSHAADGMGIGGAIGGTVGAVLAAIVGVGTAIAIPGLGLVVAGPIAAALAGAGAGGATGGDISARIGARHPEERVRDYERGINEGGIVIGTKYRDADHARELEKDYTTYGGTHVRY